MSRSLAPAIAVFGTASDVGKSVVATALCRVLSDRGYRVAPFKAQNMSNNSGVTREGSEMGRAQMVQARAGRAEPHVDMNPVLIKPGTGAATQVVVLGRARRGGDDAISAVRVDDLKSTALSALERIRRRFDLVVIEGAGSCAEVNLRATDFVNFDVAHAADAPVVLVADIDRGGVFAQIVGTLAVLPEADRDRVRGLVVNRFRGDSTLFDDGVAWLERTTRLPVFGVLPFLPDLGIDAEDAVMLERSQRGGERPTRAGGAGAARVGVVQLPHISNFTDIEPLAQHPRAHVEYLVRPPDLEDYDLVVLPGSKAVRADLQWLRDSGWAPALSRHVARGGRLGGICGGYQMLGVEIDDGIGAEGAPGRSQGLALLPVSTTFETEKTLRRVSGRWLENGRSIHGYEIHMGQTERHDGAPAAELVDDDALGQPWLDGARAHDGRVWGTYVHGIFDDRGFLDAMLDEIGAAPYHGPDASLGREASLDRLAEHFRRHVDVDALSALVEG